MLVAEKNRNDTMVENLKNKTIHGVLWSAIERFSLQGVQFLINIIMARLLLPSEYGLVAMLAIFLQISQVFIDSGFTNALIQRKNRTEVDYSTVFYFNIFISVVFYLILFIVAPWIAGFYHMPVLIAITRVIALNLIISALSAVHRTRLTINIDFKTQSKASLIAAFLSGGIGIGMAYLGYGVWALVFQSILNSLFLTFLLHYFVKWRPLRVFSICSFKSLFNFGSKLLLSSLLHTIYRNLYTLVIGRKFSARDLGYYTRSEQFAVFPSSNLSAIISRVTFPVLSSIQDDDVRLFVAYRRYIRFASMVIFPLMVGLAVLAKPTVSFLLTDKWLAVVPLLQILCFDWMFDHLSMINSNLLYVKGRSDLVLKLEIIKKIMATSILFASIPFGLVGMCWGRVIYSLIATYLNTFYTKRFIGLSFWIQLRDIFPYFILSICMGLVVWTLSMLEMQNWVHLFCGRLLGVTVYLGGIYCFQRDDLKEMLTLMKMINH